ncbi:hypothetical protein VTK73DRAFT_4389 [Phialemonium thermophilum]|uniref:Uncharacterized protein n=1 Tax=Phialemonium thermophilum TaxID=223376 RepID=A0ABR3Y0R2_9PEZI
MGAEQSSARDSSAHASPSTAAKTCYYELLGLGRQATDDEIRKAYKKKALELHPDRNIGDTENATKKFAQIQTAYEVLSDPQERAWYDSHRDAILSGDDDYSRGPSEHYNTQVTHAKDIYALMGRFNSSVPMDDSPRGFFGILNAFFSQLATEEVAACQLEGLPPIWYPEFGSAQADYNNVAKPFYNIWSSFSTRKQFSWRDKYRLSDAPDRRIRRLMEKENKKLREEGIREFNDAVRSFVAFVKKRDTRYVPNAQSEVERQRILRDSAAAQAARSRAANQEKLASYTVPDWAQQRDNEDINDEFSISEEESEVEHFECVVCNKIFKSEKQYETHEKSKKHMKAVQQIQRQMRRENADLDLQQPLSEGTAAGPLQEIRGASGMSSDEEPVSQVEICQEKASDSPTCRSVSHVTESDRADDLSGDEYASRSSVEARLRPYDPQAAKTEDVSKNKESDIEPLASAVDGMKITGHSEAKKTGKAKARREKKAARTMPNDQTKCMACNQVFESRTKLFSHIRELGHAAPISQGTNETKKSRR